MQGIDLPYPGYVILSGCLETHGCKRLIRGSERPTGKLCFVKKHFLLMVIEHQLESKAACASSRVFKKCKFMVTVF